MSPLYPPQHTYWTIDEVQRQRMGTSKGVWKVWFKNENNVVFSQPSLAPNHDPDVSKCTKSRAQKRMFERNSLLSRVDKNHLRLLMPFCMRNCREQNYDQYLCPSYNAVCPAWTIAVVNGVGRGKLCEVLSDQISIKATSAASSLALFKKSPSYQKRAWYFFPPIIIYADHAVRQPVRKGYQSLLTTRKGQFSTDLACRIYNWSQDLMHCRFLESWSGTTNTNSRRTPLTFEKHLPLWTLCVGSRRGWTGGVRRHDEDWLMGTGVNLSIAIL